MDEQQNVVWKAQYDAFGEANIEVEQVEFNLRFPGQYYDGETGTHYNYYRDYDPSLGRYVQSDPIGLRGGINTYGYVLQNPVMLIDPFGLYCQNAREPGCGYIGNPYEGYNSGEASAFPASTNTPEARMGACVFSAVTIDIILFWGLEKGASSVWKLYHGEIELAGKGAAMGKGGAFLLGSYFRDCGMEFPKVDEPAEGAECIMPSNEKINWFE